MEAVVHTQAAAEQVSQVRISLKENEEVEILEAATLKADGRRLDVPVDKIFDSAVKPYGKQRIVIFPDVAVGDRLRMISRTIQKHPEFRGGLFLEPVANTDGGERSLRITLDAPADMKLHIVAKGLRQKVTRGTSRTNYEWELIPSPYKGISFDLLFLYAYTQRLQISSFADWQAAGRAYCDVINAAATVTPEVAALAKQIILGKSNRIDQARAIFDWLDRNITESDTPRAAGAPNPVSVTLAARHGDATEVAALMQALLAGVGIEAHAVRSDNLRIVDEYDVPNPTFGSAIVCMPEFDLYADPKPGDSRDVAFGVLNEEHYGGQALRCGPGKPNLIRMPAASVDTNTIILKTDIIVNTDGLARGTSTISARGAYKNSMRSQRKSLRFTNAAVHIEKDLRTQGLSGSGQFTALALGEDEDSILKTKFSIDGSILGDDYPQPLIAGPRFFTRAYSTYAQTLRPNRATGFFCSPSAWHETVTYHLPAGWRPKMLPKDVERRGGPAVFTAHYTWRENQLVVERRFEMRSESSNCPAAMVADVLPVAKAANRNEEERITFIPAGKAAQN